jgi:hypothetical protein
MRFKAETRWKTRRMGSAAESARVLNEDRLRNFPETDRKIAFVCECADPGCRRTVVLTAGQYGAVRPGLVLHPAHAERA